MRKNQRRSTKFFLPRGPVNHAAQNPSFNIPFTLNILKGMIHAGGFFLLFGDGGEILRLDSLGGEEFSWLMVPANDDL